LQIANEKPDSIALSVAVESGWGLSN